MNIRKRLILKPKVVTPWDPAAGAVRQVLDFAPHGADDYLLTVVVAPDQTPAGPCSFFVLPGNAPLATEFPGAVLKTASNGALLCSDCFAA